jgi:hypothetical protein
VNLLRAAPSHASCGDGTNTCSNPEGSFTIGNVDEKGKFRGTSALVGVLACRRILAPILTRGVFAWLA